MVEVTFAPGAVTSGANIDLPAGSPPIGEVVAARSNELTEGAPNTLAQTTPTPTKVDKDTVTLDANTTASTLLTLVYRPVGELVLV